MRERSIVAPRRRAIWSTQSSTAESIPRPSRSIFRKPASAHESLSHWQIWRPSIAAGWTGTSSTSGRLEMTIPPGCWEMCRGQPGDLVRERAERSPAGGGVVAGEPLDLLGDPVRVPFRDAREPLELGRGQAERLAEVADRPARVVGREGGDEGGVLAAVPLGDPDDQLLADVAREVEVDVGDRGELAVEEAAEREVGLDRVDVGKPGQVADDRADRAAAAAPGRERVAGRAGAAHLGGDLAGELEHLPVQEEEPGELQLGDEGELLPQSCSRTIAIVRPLVAVSERTLADVAELAVGGLEAVGEVGIAVAELLGQVEAQAGGDLGRAEHGVAVLREAVDHLLGREQDGLVVAAPLLLAAVERGAAADRDERVLECATPLVVGVDVAGGDGGDAEVAGELSQGGDAAGVAALVRALELDVEAVPPERRRDARGSVRILRPQAVPCAARQADEAVGVREQRLERQLRGKGIGALLRPGARVRLGEQPAEVRVALRRLDEQRDVGATVETDLGAGDRADAERLGRVGELERAVDAVVVGERQRLVAELGGARGELLGLRGPVEERIR